MSSCDLTDPIPPAVMRLKICRTLVALLALLAGAAVAATVVWMRLPSPPGDPDPRVLIGMLTAYCLVGPVLFGWAAGPHPLNALEWGLALGVPAVALGLIHIGYVRRASFAAVAAAVAIWSGFGGYAAFLAVTGSI